MLTRRDDLQAKGARVMMQHVTKAGVGKIFSSDSFPLIATHIHVPDALAPPPSRPLGVPYGGISFLRQIERSGCDGTEQSTSAPQQFRRHSGDLLLRLERAPGLGNKGDGL